MTYAELDRIGERSKRLLDFLSSPRAYALKFDAVKQLLSDTFILLATAHDLLADLDDCGYGYSEADEFAIDEEPQEAK